MPLCKDARRLIPDPQNEPDFYTISAQYPLKGEQSGVGKNVPEEELKPAAKQQPEHSTVTLSCDAPAVNSTMIPSLSAVIPAATRPAESMAPSLEPPPPMTLASQMESVAPLRMAACILPPANAFAAAGSSAHVAAAGCVSSANLISSPTAAASTLGCRLVSEVSWLLQQLPPAKVHRSATATTPSSYHSAAATAVPDPAVWLCALDVAQARRQHQEAAATASLARQHQQLLQQEEAALIAAVEAAQVRQEAALLAAVQQRKQQIVSRLLLGVDARVQCSSSNSSGLNATGGNDNVQDTSALLDYIRRMQQHDG